MCSFCSESIKQALGRMDGVYDVRVSLAHEEVLVRYDPARVKESELRKTLRQLGYTLRDSREERTYEEVEAELKREKRRLWGSSFWSDGYSYESIGSVTSEAMEYYITRQQGKHWLHHDRVGEVETIDLTQRPEMARKYGILGCPALAINGKVEFVGGVDEAALRRLLSD